jgi:hypothetical protein
MILVNGADPSLANEVPRLLELRHTPLLHADLEDPPIFVLSFENCPTLGQVMRKRLLDINVLAGGTGN